MNRNWSSKLALTALTLIIGFGILPLTGCGSRAEQTSKHVAHITGAQFDTEVTQATSPVIVDFYATWCGPCKRLSPMLDEIAGSFTNKVKFVKVDVDEATAVAKQFNIEAIPTLIFFKDGKVSDRMMGLPSEQELKTRIASFAQ